MFPQPLQPSQLVSRWEWVRGVVKGEGVERGNRWEKARRERRGGERGGKGGKWEERRESEERIA